MSGLVTARLYTADRPIDLSPGVRWGGMSPGGRRGGMGTAVRRGGMGMRVGRGTSAVLVIPRDRGLRDPFMIMVSRRCSPVVLEPGRLLLVDRHTVSAPPVVRERRDLADVVVTRRSGSRRTALGLARKGLERHPGAEIVITAHPGGCLAGFRSGLLAETTGVTERTDLSVLGSLLHCWLVAGLPFTGLQSAAVALGTAGSDGLMVVARATIGPVWSVFEGRAAS